jgi:hypothetical protein
MRQFVVAVVLGTALAATASSAFAVQGNGAGRLPNSLTQGASIQTSVNKPNVATPVDPVDPASHQYEQYWMTKGGQTR